MSERETTGRITPATVEKRQALLYFVERELAPQPIVQGVVGIGSIATGLARPDSDIDAIVFFDPLDRYIVPAESKWSPADGSFHSIFSEDAGLEDSLQLDFARLDLGQYADPAFKWPEGRCAELQKGWLAFDRSDRVAELIARRTAYSESARTVRLDEAVTWLDQHLSDNGPQIRWDSLGPAIAHDRLQAAYEYLVQALFAYNRTWRPWRNRQMSALLVLPWLPARFAERVLDALNSSSSDHAGYMARASSLTSLFHELLDRLVAEGLYGQDPISEAFIRSHEEPGRAWNMDEWNEERQRRMLGS